MTIRLSLIALGLTGWLTASTFGADDIEVLARGPVHEAYATPSEREPKPSPVIAKEPPKAIEELPPDQKPAGDNVQWMPGYWSWDDDKKDFVWVSGFWRNAPEGRAWVPGSWAKTGDGWQWTGGFWSAANAGQEDKASVDYLPQPPAPLDADGPVLPQPSSTDVYVPGTWVYHDRYLWQPGYWSGYQADRVWVAPFYRWTPAGYLFVDGYWDYPLESRGLLFAPAYIPPAVYADPAFVYTPSYVVQENCLFGSLFCRRGFGSYYFGDYFSPTYASLGFSAWCGNVGISVGFGGSRWYDPLFNYYRCGYRSDPFWGGGGINDLYAGRYRGDYVRPPTTLVQQNTLINNITRNRTTINNVNVNNVNMLTSLNQVGRSGRRNLQPVSDPARREFAQTAHAGRRASEERASTETRLASRPGAGGPQRRTAVLPAIHHPGAAARVGPDGATSRRPGAGSPTGANRNPATERAPRPANVGGPLRPSVPSSAANRGNNSTPGTARAPMANRSTPQLPSPQPRTTSPNLNRPGVQTATPPTARPAVPNRSTPGPNVPAPNLNRQAPRTVTPQTRPAVPNRATSRPNVPAPNVNRPTPPTARPAVPNPSTPRPNVAAPNLNRPVPRTVTPPARTVRPPTVTPPRARPAVAAPRATPAAPRNVARPAAPRPPVARPAAAPHAPRPAAANRPPSIRKR
jgi:WXXGXW repeat (2 copies)